MMRTTLFGFFIGFFVFGTIVLFATLLPGQF